VSAISSFELFVARRYLMAKRRQAIVPVITLISIMGLAAGVMALVVALAINNGFRQTLQSLLLGATAHISVMEKEPGSGIEDWRELSEKLKTISGVKEVSPALYGSVFFAGPMQSGGGTLKGSADVKEDGIVLGSKLAKSIGMMKGSRLTVISPQGELTPYGMRPAYYRMTVAGTFETGFWDLDAQWARASLPTVQRILGTSDVVNMIELKLEDIHRAREIAEIVQAQLPKKLAATSWMEQNKPLLNALTTERTVTFITIGLIVLVAALNILITLTMMVMEKNRDIAVLVSMGAKRRQIRRIFVMQGGLIGLIGTILGLVAGYLICYFAGHGQWITLDPEVYALGHVPFEPRWLDGFVVAAAAIGTSLIATLYPARAASRIAPAEALRYE